MKRLMILVLLGGLAITLTPAPAVAQPYPVFPYPAPPPPPVPYYFTPRYQYNYQYTVGGTLPLYIGNVSYVYRQFRSYYGTVPPVIYAPTYIPPIYGNYGGYSYGYGSGYGSNYLQQMQRDLANAQAGVVRPGAIYPTDVWRSSQPMVLEPTPGGTGMPPAGGVKPDAARITSGETLNELLDEIARLEGGGAKGMSPFVPPGVLADTRYAGSPAADLLEIVRLADAGLKYPSVFGRPALKPLVTDLLNDFAQVVAAIKSGKAPTAVQVAKVETSYRLLRDAAAPFLKDLTPDETTRVREFAKRFESALGALQAGAGAGLVDPKWQTEGTSVSDMVKHMSKNRLRFGPAMSGGEESYLTLYRDFSAYLFVLGEAKK